MADRRLVEYTEPRLEFGPVWTLLVERSSEGPPGGLVTIRHLDIEGAEQNAMTIVMDDLRRLDVATDWARGTSLRGGTDLDGATERGPIGSEIADAGDFAARWNESSPPRREQMTATIREAMREKAYRFQADVDGELARLRETVAALRALHAPVWLWLPYPDADYSFPSREEAIDYLTGPEDNDAERQLATAEVTKFQVCGHCMRIEREQASERGYEHADWPCATAKAGGWG